jgi:hypothetical protein
MAFPRVLRRMMMGHPGLSTPVHRILMISLGFLFILIHNRRAYPSV